jgi:hypothetical protein
MATLLSDDVRPNVSFAPVGGGVRHVTTKLVRYHLPRCNLSIWDTWGFSGSNYRDNTLAHIFEGKLPSGWEMGELHGDRQSQLASGKATAHLRRIHAAILVLNYSDIKDAKFKFALSEQFRHFKEFSPIVVVSKVFYRFNPFLITVLTNMRCKIFSRSLLLFTFTSIFVLLLYSI